MKSMVALIHREYLEHKGAFLYGPAAILAVLTLFMLSAFAFGRVRMPFEVGVPSLLKFFQFGFFGMAALWFVYLLGTLFFYYADAFNADRRNNAMFFWKSMPVSDFQVLSSKMLAGMSIFPALIFGALLLTALLLYVMTALASVVLPNLIVPDTPQLLLSTWNIALFALAYLILALLWYAPFFAWVGALSTVVGRWSIPLAFLIPGLIGLMENIALVDTGPRAGYVLTYLRERLHFGLEREDFQAAFMQSSLDVGRLFSGLIANIDWSQMAGGLIFAALAVYAASEYRRRVIAT